MAYVIAAYGLVIVTLVGYGCRVQRLRRQLECSVTVEPHAAREP